MAAALYPSRNDSGPNSHTTNVFSRPLMTELDFRDARYPSLPTASRSSQRSSTMLPSTERSGWDTTPSANEESPPRSFEPAALTSGWASERPTSAAVDEPPRSQSRAAASDLQSIRSQSQSQDPQRSVVSYALPPGSNRRVVERYSLDDNNDIDDDTQQATPSPDSEETRPTMTDPMPVPIRGRSDPLPTVRRGMSQEPQMSMLPSAPRHPSLPAAGIGAGSSKSNTATFTPAIMPLSASPGYTPPVSPRHRTYPQHPTYIQNTAPTPVNPIYSPKPQEEICVECAMRDQDMADVDVTSPGVWERDSDAVFEDLRQRELEEERTGVINADEPPRPRIRGGRLTEQNVKMWLSVNPREPASKQQTLSTYLKSQRALLEAEALAHARAMQEAKQLDNRMRDAYSQLRRSAYDMGSSAAPADDSGGVRIKPPLSPSTPVRNSMHDRSHSRDVTLLENGMIVEHVDVRKEEREARERKRKEDRRARKSSRSSGIDVTSLMSTQSLTPPTDSGVALKPYSRYSQTSSARPMSVLTAPADRPDLPRAYSQASFSDVHSLGSASPRRTRFFGMKNFRDGWRSQDSLAVSGMSGSMMDMHVALQREAQYTQRQSTVDVSSRRSQLWPSNELRPTMSRQSRQSDEKVKKKKKGLAKLWGFVTRSSKTDNSGREESSSIQRTEDDLPLAPPPPLSYLVNRGPGEHPNGGSRHSSLQSPSMPKLGLSVSPPTAPSSMLPSPASSRPSGADLDAAVEVARNGGPYEDQEYRYIDDNRLGSKTLHTMLSEPDIRQRFSPTQPLPDVTNRPPAPTRLSREKSLPPIPGEARPRPLPNVADTRPQTMHAFDPRTLPAGSRPPYDFLPPQAPFRNSDNRRQSFNGLASRPNLDGLQTPPQRMSFGPKYDEFGISRRSLHLGHVQENPSVQSFMTPSSKRKSRFNLSSLLGKKQSAPERDLMRDSVAQQLPAYSMRNSGSDAQDEVMTNGYATSTSRHSALSASPAGPRLSVTSRKALEELVSQDSDFVAYRYPSNDQRLDLLR